MDNERLAEIIQNGEKGRLPELWAQVERFAAQQAARRILVVQPGTVIDYEDLYQTGYIALAEAVETYNYEKGMSFIGWYKFYLQAAFNDALGLRTERQRNDPIYHAARLEAPLSDSEDEGTLLDCIPDYHAKQSMEDAENRIWREQLNDVLERAMDQLPEDDADMLRLHYYHGQSFRRISEIQGRTNAQVYERHKLSLKKLRTGSRSMELRQYIELCTPYYAHVGPAKFNSTHTSAVEMAVLRREELMLRR